MSEACNNRSAFVAKLLYLLTYGRTHALILITVNFVTGLTLFIAISYMSFMAEYQ